MQYRKWLSLAAAAALAAGLSGCELLPEEAVYESKPVIRSYTQAEYDLAYAQYGDVESTETLSLKYMAVSTETLAYRVGGEYYGTVYVEKGDLVQKGQLLAELDLSDLQERIDSEKANIASLEMRLRQTKERHDLAVSQRRALLAILPPEEAAAEKTPEETAATYDASIQSLEDSLSIARLQLDEEEANLAERQLYAGIDGAITYVRTVTEGARSVEGETFIRIADATNSVFSGLTANAALLPAGTVVSVYCQKEYLEAVVVTAEELGFATEAPDSKGRVTVYFRLLAPSGTLETGDRATLVLTLDLVKDVLYVPLEAVHTVEGRTFVYTKDEDGLKNMREVEVGLCSAKLAEIKSGLAQGDNVILD